MLNNKKGRADVAAPTQPAAEKPFSGDLQPQSNLTTDEVTEQEEIVLRELEMSIVERVLSKYCTQINRALPKLMRRRVYEKGKNDLAAYWLQPATYEYGISRLAEWLGL